MEISVSEWVGGRGAQLSLSAPSEGTWGRSARDSLDAYTAERRENR